ncbi:hypothetical protein ABZ858_05875 [Streptomyces sp. NPDC047017]|uniref:hypothetical protein n=1 Tax=Streptomyces sp. NPDC047017 TaxID=3155024 RepID=UPI00340ADC12
MAQIGLSRRPSAGHHPAVPHWGVTHMPERVRDHRILIAATALTAALCTAAVTPALAGNAPARAAHPAPTARDTARTTAAPPVVQGDPRGVTQRVADFYGAYIDTLWDGSDPASAADARALKSFYLTADARRKVAAYEARAHADGILFARHVPVRWKVAYTGSGAGHATNRVTLTWGDDRNARVTKIDVRSDLRTRKISDLKPAG